MTADDRLPPQPQHPDLDTLADLRAGVLDAATAERVRAHVAGCAQCTGVLEALDAVGADLQALPTPVIPAAVAARLDATLADLRRGDRDPAAAGPGTGSGTATAAGRARSGDAVRTAGDRPASRDGRPADLAAARARRRQRISRSLGAVAAAVAVLAAGALVRDSGIGQGSDDSFGGGSSAQDAPISASGESGTSGLSVTAYDEGTLRADLPQIEQRSALGLIAGPGDTGRAGVMADAGRRTACANTIPGAAGQLRAVERIEYEGRPAYVFVFTDGRGRTGYVVTDDCGASSALPASVLDTVS